MVNDVFLQIDERECDQRQNGRAPHRQMHAEETAGGISFRITGGGPFQQASTTDQHAPARTQNGFQRDHGFVGQKN